MAQDLSRSAFDPRTPKHWSGVRAQQGRLISDDDWNEADAIGAEDVRRTRVQVVGPTGSPDAGFTVDNPRLNGSRIDFDLLPGTIYVGGLRVTLEGREAFSQQSDWLQQLPADRPDLDAPERFDAVYLEVWEQPVTAVEDTELTEVALGGPDTSVRMRTMRRVRVLPGVGTTSCARAWDAVQGHLGAALSEENELLPSASLTVGQVSAGGPPADLCSPSVLGGYLGAENQAIRVEIGPDGASLLWSYDNASPLYRVQVTSVGGAEAIRFLQPPRDETHWPRSQQTVELLPWSAVLPNNQKVAESHGGFLTSVATSYDPTARTITTTAQVPSGFGTAWQGRPDAGTLSSVQDSYFYLRVWNRGADTASTETLPFIAGKPVELSGTGLTVTLQGAPFRPGDHWVIAARPESPARVVPWRLETGLVAQGPRRFYAPLAIVRWRRAGPQTAFDCRATFLPLTRTRGCCVVLSPATNWEHTLDALGGEDDVCVCFQPGDYVATRTFVFRNRTVRIHGDGEGSRIVGKDLETVFLFDGCSSVDVSDLSVRAGATMSTRGAPKPHLAGAVTAVDCDRVSVARVDARCASAPTTAAAAISVYTSFDGARAAAASATVTGCRVVVGGNQVGIQVVNIGRSRIVDNTVRVDVAETGVFPRDWLQDKAFLRRFRRTLIYGYRLENTFFAFPITVGGVPVWIFCDPRLGDPWNTVANWRRLPTRRRDRLAVGDHLYDLAESILRGEGSIGANISRAFRFFIRELEEVQASSGTRLVGAGGIVVGGTTAEDVQISSNTVRDVVQGIHVGVSTRRPRGPVQGGAALDSAGRVVIDRNDVGITLMPENAEGRHAIFVGNNRSLLVDGNMLSCEKVGTGDRLWVEGIRVYGFFGPSSLVVRNHLTGFNVGIRAAAVNNKPLGPSSLWRVADNIAVGAAAAVDLSLKVGRSDFVDSAGNRP